jgi:hypothetical protein
MSDARVIPFDDDPERRRRGTTNAPEPLAASPWEGRVAGAL